MPPQGHLRNLLAGVVREGQQPDGPIEYIFPAPRHRQGGSQEAGPSQVPDARRTQPETMESTGRNTPVGATRRPDQGTYVLPHQRGKRSQNVEVDPFESLVTEPTHPGAMRRNFTAEATRSGAQDIHLLPHQRGRRVQTPEAGSHEGQTVEPTHLRPLEAALTRYVPLEPTRPGRQEPYLLPHQRGRQVQTPEAGPSGSHIDEPTQARGMELAGRDATPETSGRDGYLLPHQRGRQIQTAESGPPEANRTESTQPRTMEPAGQNVTPEATYSGGWVPPHLRGKRVQAPEVEVRNLQPTQPGTMESTGQNPTATTAAPPTEQSRVSSSVRTGQGFDGSPGQDRRLPRHEVEEVKDKQVVNPLAQNGQGSAPTPADNSNKSFAKRNTGLRASRWASDTDEEPAPAKKDESEDNKPWDAASSAIDYKSPHRDAVRDVDPGNEADNESNFDDTEHNVETRAENEDAPEKEKNDDENDTGNQWDHAMAIVKWKPHGSTTESEVASDVESNVNSAEAPSIEPSYLEYWASHAHRVEATFLRENIRNHEECDVNTEDGTLLPRIEDEGTKMNTDLKITQLTQTATTSAKIFRKVRRRLLREERPRSPAREPIYGNRYDVTEHCYLRPAVEKDVEEVAQVYNEEATLGYSLMDTKPVKAETFLELLSVCTQEKMPFIVAVERRRAPDGNREPHILGFSVVTAINRGIFGSFQTRSMPGGKVTVVVSRRHRRKKIGTALLDVIFHNCSPLYESKGGYTFLNFFHDNRFMGTEENPRLWFYFQFEILICSLGNEETTRQGDEFKWIKEWLEKRFSAMLEQYEGNLHYDERQKKWLDKLVFRHRVRDMGYGNWHQPHPLPPMSASVAPRTRAIGRGNMRSSDE
ncbi:hypothetical protein GGS20DRAFT_583146 [Poronia punctata]|nr:hypothetical protein GGS20DRAFT_583146 [Poronia punctata]